MRISEQFAIIPLIESKDYGSVGIDSDGVDLGKLHSLCAVFVFGAITGDSVLKVYAGATAAKTTAVAFKYRLGAADYKVALADQSGAFTDVTSSGLTLTAATFDHRQVIIEIDSQAMPADKGWVTFEINSTATVMNVGAVGIGPARAVGNLPPSVI